MAEGSYEHECMRAELLGLEKPSKEIFEANLKLKSEIEQDEIETEQLKELSLEDEQMNGTSGKLDELNSILSITQNKINKFKKTCGSLTNMLKFRSTPSGSATASNENLSSNNVNGTTEGNTINDALDTLDTMKDNEKQTNIQVIKKTSADMQTKITSQIDKLDSMLTKAENASYTMDKQTKQMKKM